MKIDDVEDRLLHSSHADNCAWHHGKPLDDGLLHPMRRNGNQAEHQQTQRLVAWQWHDRKQCSLVPRNLLTVLNAVLYGTCVMLCHIWNDIMAVKYNWKLRSITSSMWTMVDGMWGPVDWSLGLGTSLSITYQAFMRVLWLESAKRRLFFEESTYKF